MSVTHECERALLDPSEIIILYPVEEIVLAWNRLLY